MKPPRWTAVSQSAFPWEREALEFARANLPDHEPWRAWSNFEFIDDEGRVNEVDLLVLTPAGLVLVEIKSRPGRVRGDAQTWIWTTDGRPYVSDNPLPLANRKAKRLATVLRRQEAVGGRGAKRSAAPWVEPLIWLSHVKEAPRIDQGSAMRVAIAAKAGETDGPGLVSMLLRAEELGFGRRGAVDSTAVRTITRALDQAGIRAPGRGRRVGDYELEKLLTEGENWQDFAARHVATGVARRIRIYPFARAATPEARDKLVRMALREFRVLEGVEHPGIQRVLDYREAEMGPALVFEHDPASVRLDRYLAEHNQSLPVAARLALVRQLAEAMAFAHSKRLFHRGLAPQNILVRNPEGEAPRLQITNWQVASRGEGSQSGIPMTAGTMHVEEHLTDPAKLYLAPEAAYGVEDGAAQADVFSLGATAYFIFSGKPPADSVLELPARLRETDGLRLSSAVNVVVLTPLDDTDLGDDIRARLHRGRLERTDRWAVLRGAFQVREIDSRLRRQLWLADLLISHPPAGGLYAPAPGGVLDWETAWAAFREHGLRMAADAADLVALIEWTLDGVGLARLADLPADAQTAVAGRLAEGAGPGAVPLLGAVTSRRGADVLALGLVCGVLFGGDQNDPRLRDAAVRLEPMVGGVKVDLAGGQAFAAAARRVLQRLTSADQAQARTAQSRAEAILRDVRAEEFAALSPALDIGLEARMLDAAKALSIAADSGRADDATRAWDVVAMTQKPNHDRARDQAQRLDRLMMAARLACWLATDATNALDFAEAAKRYAGDSGFADLARKVLRAGDSLPDVAAAYARLREAAMSRREIENQRFAQTLAASNLDGHQTVMAAPIERLLDLVVAPLARQAPVLFLVLDGLSFAAWRELAATLPRLGWMELKRVAEPLPSTSVAVLPTVTEVSRASLFCGRLARGQQSVEKAGFTAHRALVSASHAGKPPLLFHKAELGPGPELAPGVGAAVEDAHQRVVAVVHNALDAQLSGSDQIEFSWSAEALRQVAALLRLARDAGRLVVVTGDHGHVIEAGTSLAPLGSGADRWRSGDPAAEGEILLTGGRVLAPNGGSSIIAAWSERLRYAGKHDGYHGGASPQEVLVPIAVLGAGEPLTGWDVAPPNEPAWWAGATEFSPRVMPDYRATTLQPAPTSRRGAAGVQQADLFAASPAIAIVPEPEVATPTWTSALFASSAYGAQRRLAGRGAPPDEQVLGLLLALSARGGRLSRGALAQALSQPALRIGGMVNAARRLVNLDQAQVLTIDGEDVIFDERLLRAQFELDGGR